MQRSPIDRRRALTRLCATTAALAAAASGWAWTAPTRPPFIQAWLTAYPNSTSADNVVLGTGQVCQLCHETLTGGDGWNTYGWSLREFMQTGSTIDEALLLVEGLDSDGDPTGSTDLEEIDADTQPGWTDGPNNTIYYADGSTLPNQNPPANILGSLDPPALSYCFGDGTGTPCPCSNESAPGAGQGCANSTGSGALATATGSNSVAADDLTFQGANLLPNQPALLFVGQNAINGGNGITFGDGLRCAGFGVVRLGVKTPSAGGQATWGPSLAGTGGWSSGDTRRFQIWYRNPTGSPCATNFNLSNGLEVSFTP